MKLEEDLSEEIKQQITTAEVSNITIENINDASKPLVYQYSVKVPGYGQKTGKRLFVQPGFFEYGSTPLFSSANRKYDVYFLYPWSEVDDIEINLPKGFSLDSADRPENLADSNKISMLQINIGVDREQTFMRYNRKFYFGSGGRILFPVSAYQPVKTLFDAFHKADTHTITLKQK